VLGILGLVFLGYVWAKVDLVRVGYQLEELSTIKSRLQRENDQLQLRISRLTAPNRIAFEAGKQLGLLPPRPEQIVLVSVNPSVDPSPSGLEVDQFVTVAKSMSTRK
jgi:cell division protein FtsL